MKKASLNKNVIVGVSILLLVSCKHTEDKVVNTVAEMELIKDAIHNCIGWAQNKDIQLLYSVIANDSLYLEVHPAGAVIQGYDNFRKQEEFWMSPYFKAIRYEIKDLRINLSRSGDVAWWFGILDDINEWKGEPANWENTRWTGVLEKREGRWVIVQMHFSFACE